MKTAKKVLALLLSVLMVFTMVSNSVVAIAETEPAEKTQIEDVENSMSNTFDSIKGIIEGVHNLVGGIMSVLGKECVFCDEIHGKTEDTEEPTEPETPPSEPEVPVEPEEPTEPEPPVEPEEPTEPEEPKEDEPTEDKIDNAFDSIGGLFDSIHNLVGSILAIFGKECPFCDKVHGKDEGKTEEPDEDGYYTVTFDLNYEGAPKTEKQKVKAGEYVNVPGDPEREGYAFVGWYTSEDKNTAFDYINTVINSNYNLVAIWINSTDTTDSDGDGIIDVLEDYHATNKFSEDTDGDRLSDYIEFTVTYTDPLKEDTDGDNIIDGDDDLDEDGLSNITEVEIGTNPLAVDTDVDGIEDFDELRRYNTNALLFDTDSDGVSDSKEIELGTDPLMAQERFKVSYSSDYNDEGAKPSVDIELAGNQVETLSISPYENDMFFPETMPGYMGKAYDFYVDGSFEKATISFEFAMEELKNNSNPTIYYFNEITQTLEALVTTIKGNIASAEVTHFSKYILVDRTIYEESFSWIDVWDSTKNYAGVEIVLVIDDSGSMTSNDRYNQRLSVAKNLINGLPQNSKIGIVKFASSTSVLTSSLTSSKETANSYLTTSYFKSYGGTYMYEAINSAFNLFETSDETIMKVVVVLSDGDTSNTSKHSSTINAANSNHIKIYTVGLGNSTSYFNRYLKPLAVNTGGAFYLAANADQLSDIYDSISQKIDIETDSDNDGIPDYYEDNMIIFNGVEIALNKDDSDTDGDGLLDGEEIELNYEYNEDRTKVKVTGKILTDPLDAYSDFDAYDDYSEINVYYTDPLERNVVIDGYRVETLTKNDYYQSSAYKNRYDNEPLLRASIWTGNNIYGSNHSEKLIYKQLLLSFFETNSEAAQRRQEIEEAADLANDIYKSLKNVVEKGIEKAEEANYTDTVEYLDNLKSQMDNIKKSMIDMKYAPGTSIDDFYRKSGELTDAYSEAMNKSDELNEVLSNAQKSSSGKKKLKLDIPTKLSGTLKAIEIGSDLFTLGMPAYEAYRDSITLKSNIVTIRNNIYLLEAVVKRTNNTALRDAANEILISAQNEYAAKLSSITQALENMGYAVIAEGIHELVGMIPVVGFWIELGLGIVDLIVPVSAQSKECLNIYGAAKTADCLSSDLSSYLTGKAQYDCSNSIIYAVYGKSANESVKRFVNLADMRILGEQKMIDMQKIGGGFLQFLKKVFGGDPEGVKNTCQSNINTINGFKNNYVGKY